MKSQFNLKTVSTFERTKENNGKAYGVTVNGEAAMAETADRQASIDFAQNIFNQSNNAQLWHWNGDTGENTLIDQTN